MKKKYTIVVVMILLAVLLVSGCGRLTESAYPETPPAGRKPGRRRNCYNFLTTLPDFLLFPSAAIILEYRRKCPLPMTPLKPPSVAAL